MITTQKQIRALFWETFPSLPRRRYRYGSGPTAPLVYPVETRCAFVDFLDWLHRSGEISGALADRAQL